MGLGGIGFRRRSKRRGRLSQRFLGEVLVIPSNVPHEAVALEDTLDVDVFSPPRSDWLDGSDAYLREQPS
jgi:hypothetical protein